MRVDSSIVSGVLSRIKCEYIHYIRRFEARLPTLLLCQTPGGEVFSLLCIPRLVNVNQSEVPCNCSTSCGACCGLPLTLSGKAFNTTTIPGMPHETVSLRWPQDDKWRHSSWSICFCRVATGTKQASTVAGDDRCELTKKRITYR